MRPGSLARLLSAPLAWRSLVALAAVLVVAGSSLAAPSPADPRSADDPHLIDQLLVASPSMGDPNFEQTVIFMVAHDAGGAMGLVVNRQMGVRPLSEILESLNDADSGAQGDIPAHFGGPVELGRGFVLHSPDYVGDTTLVESHHAALTSSVDVLRALGAGKGPRHGFIAFGYAGWAPGQLEAEIAEDAWVIVPANEKLIFGHDNDGKWDRAISKRGIDL